MQVSIPKWYNSKLTVTPGLPGRIRFQFQNGTIQRATAGDVLTLQAEFQFQNGTIQRSIFHLTQ